MSHFDNPLSEHDRQVILYNVISFNAFSIFCCVLVLTLYFFFKKRHPASVDRVSIRLAVATSGVDLLYSFIQIWSNLPLTEDQCGIATFSYVFVTLLSCFLIAMVAVNLHLVFLLNKERTEVYEPWYYILSFVLALIISSVGWFSDQYGMDPVITGCWFSKDGTLEGLVWQWLVLYGWIALIFLYCLTVVIAVSWHIHRQLSRIERSTSGSTSAPLHKLRQRKRLQVLRRILLYPSIPLISQALSVVVAMDIYFTREHTFALVILSFATTSLQGMLNSSIFLTDPMILPLIVKLIFPPKAPGKDLEAYSKLNMAAVSTAPIFMDGGKKSPTYNKEQYLNPNINRPLTANSGDAASGISTHYYAEELDNLEDYSNGAGKQPDYPPPPPPSLEKNDQRLRKSGSLHNRTAVTEALCELEEVLSMSKY